MLGDGGLKYLQPKASKSTQAGALAISYSQSEQSCLSWDPQLKGVLGQLQFSLNYIQLLAEFSVSDKTL